MNRAILSTRTVIGLVAAMGLASPSIAQDQQRSGEHHGKQEKGDKHHGKGKDQQSDQNAGPTAPTVANSGQEPVLNPVQTVGCELVAADAGNAAHFKFTNQTPWDLPVGTVIWFGPGGLQSADGIDRPLRSLDETHLTISVYYRLKSAVPRGGTFQSNYVPNPAWTKCTAVVGEAVHEPSLFVD